jgi:hypothetical protein
LESLLRPINEESYTGLKVSHPFLIWKLFTLKLTFFCNIRIWVQHVTWTHCFKYFHLTVPFITSFFEGDLYLSLHTIISLSFQLLFMNTEFRQGVYDWESDVKVCVSYRHLQ